MSLKAPTLGCLLCYDIYNMSWYKPGNKYGAIKTTHNGHVYDSKLEAAHARNLDFRLKAKDILGWDRQFKVDLYYYDSTGFKWADKSWKIDFRVQEKDGTYTLEEVKGFITEDYLHKKKLCERVWIKDNKNYRLKIYTAKDI